MLPWTSLLLLFAMHTMLCGQEMIRAANQDASPTNQRRAYGNACGPAALLNAFHYGSEKWQRPIRCRTRRRQQNTHTTTWSPSGGLSQSKHIKGACNAGTQRQGINLVDLHDIANEMCHSSLALPKVKYEILTRKEREPPTRLAKAQPRAHYQITQQRPAPYHMHTPLRLS